MPLRYRFLYRTTEESTEMPINFIPNDPMAQGGPQMRQQKARTNRPASRAGFALAKAPAQKLYPPGTPQFLFWQCREAALMTMEAWERIDGKLAAWAQGATNAKKLKLLPNEGQEPNAFYDRDSFSFFEYTSGGKTTFSGASTDIVAHEVGHGLLDAIRPDLWSVSLTEAGAFHEAFGDCLAILTALSDQETRSALLGISPDLGAANFVEATGEDLSEGIRVSTHPGLGPNHAASQPRHALNDFKWQLPTTLPSNGLPGVLSREVHSFARVFSGCFYDTIRNIFAAFPNKTEADLWLAAQTAAKLLFSGARKAPATSRFFQSVGRAMAMADQAANGGANVAAIKNAFARHSIALSISAMLAPRASLAGAAPQLRATRGAILEPETHKDILDRIGAAPRARLTVSALEIGGEEVAEAIHYRDVPLTGLSERLSGVVAVAPEPVLVGAAGTRSAIMSALPDANTTNDEVRAFVESLLDSQSIEFGRPRSAARTRSAVTEPQATAPVPTHKVVAHGGKKVLERIRFVCGGGCGHRH